MQRHTAVCVVAWFVLCTVASASDTVRVGNVRAQGPYIYYRDKTITAQAARIDLPGPGYIRSITLLLGGTAATGNVRLRLLGQEAGLQAPLLGRDLVRPIVVAKKGAGVRSVSVELPQPVPVDGDQVFVVIDQPSRGVYLLSDATRRPPVCTANGERYGYQLLQRDDGAWDMGDYQFMISMLVVPTVATGSGHFSPAALDIQDSIPAANTAMAWADANNDGLLDLLAGGRLLVNRGDGKFQDATRSAGLAGRPRLQAFIDADNDGNQDVLWLCDRDSANGSFLYINDGTGGFARGPAAIAGVTDPSCIAIADIDADGFADVFIGQKLMEESDIGIVLRNQHGEGFIRDTVLLHRTAGPSRKGSIVAAAFVDLDGRGSPDLFTVFADGRTATLHNTGGRLVPAESASGPLGVAAPFADGRGVGCHFADYDNDGDQDLLLPWAATSQREVLAMPERWRPVWPNRRGERANSLNAAAPGVSAINDIPVINERSGGAWGDADNDGRLDYVLGASCACTYIDLYRQIDAGAFQRATAAFGLRRVSGGPDLTWADVNNDGRLDLAFFADGRPVVLRNESRTNNHYVAFDLADRSAGRTSIGTAVTVYAGGRASTQVLASGRGLGVQDPPRLHFGLGTATAIDSVVVRWPGEVAGQSYSGLQVDRVFQLKATASAAGAFTVTANAFPNPFSEVLTIRFTLPERSAVRLEIFAASGELVATLLDATLDAGEHTERFTARDAAGRPLPQGTYLYRLTTTHGEAIGKAQLRR